MEGDTVLVAPDTYYENLIIQKSIHLISRAVFDDLSTWMAYDDGYVVANYNIANTVIDGGTVTIQNVTNTDDKVVLSQDKLEIFDNGNVVAEFGANTVIEGGTVTIRNSTNNNDKVIISEDCFKVYDNKSLKI